jgi:hypothetical protein
MKMAHGYLGEGYGSHGETDRDDDHRDRHWRERAWRDRDEDWRSSDRERGMMFGGSDRGRDWSDRDRGRWTGLGYGRERGDNWLQEDMQTDRSRGYSAHPDDHFRSWRDRHMSEIDRDYQDYCREREQQFHREFNQWRQQKYGNPQPLQTGMTQTGLSQDPSGTTQAIEEGTGTTRVASDPTATATLGNNSGGGGRSRR